MRIKEQRLKNTPITKYHRTKKSPIQLKGLGF